MYWVYNIGIQIRYWQYTHWISELFCFWVTNLKWYPKILEYLKMLDFDVYLCYQLVFMYQAHKCYTALLLIFDFRWTKLLYLLFYWATIIWLMWISYIYERWTWIIFSEDYDQSHRAWTCVGRGTTLSGTSLCVYVLSSNPHKNTIWVALVWVGARARA